MITFFVLLVALVALLIAAAIIVIVGGTGFVIAFADVIVCGLIIYWIIRLFRRRK